MKVAIYGVGRLGSAVAYTVMREIKPEEIQLIDIEKRFIRGEKVDLENAAKILRVPTEITLKKSHTDFSIICAGRPRSRIDEDVYFHNMRIVTSIMKDVTSPRVIIMTNPVREITLAIQKRYPKKIIMNPEIFLMAARKYQDDIAILRTKGFSSWGPAASVVPLIRRMENDKK